MTQSNGEIEQMIMTRFGMDLTEDWYDSFRYEDRVMLRDWIIADRKQHELDAKISVYEKIKQESSTTGKWEECTKSQIETIIDEHIAELEAERERLGK